MLLKGKQVPGPHYDLAAFQAEVRRGNVHVYKARAVSIICVLRECNRLRAVDYATQVVLSLTPDDFAHTLKLPDGQMHDVYGKVVGDEGWYVKIEIHPSDGQPGIISCHPAEHALVTRGGVVHGSREGGR